MKCTSKVQAERIAKYGAAKMDAEKYTLKDSTLKMLRGKQFGIVNNESGVRYITSLDPEKTFCTCPFFRENREFGICKHVAYLRNEAEWEATRIAEWEAARA